MKIDEDLYRVFLEEMHALENFRMTYTGMRSSLPLEQEDPEIKRLIEALAFFTARTNLSNQRNILATRKRMFRQFFSFLLTPLPARGLLQAIPSSRFVEPAFLPQNSEVILQANQATPAIFRTLFDLPLLPLQFDRMETVLAPHKGSRILLYFNTPYPRNDDIGQLSLYINYLNNYQSSLQVYHNLQKYLKKASITFGERLEEDEHGVECPITLGPPLAKERKEDITHPLQKIREFFHFPEAQLYLNLQMPSPPAGWNQFILCLDLHEKWPKNLRLNREVFQLFVVPLINLKNLPAQPVLCDGMQERYPVRYADITAKFELHSVTGVYQVEEEGLLPLKPGILSGSYGSYEIESSERKDGKTSSWLLINLPQAFEEPKPIAIDALWYQPWFSEKLSEALRVDLYDRQIEGLSWELLGDMRSHLDNSLKNDLEGLLQVLALQKKATFDLEELWCLLGALGSLQHSPFKEIPSLFQSLEITQLPHSQGGQKMMQIVYHFQLKEFDPSYLPLVEVFLKQLVHLLNAWTSEGVVSVKAEISGMEEVLHFE